MPPLPPTREELNKARIVAMNQVVNNHNISQLMNFFADGFHFHRTAQQTLDKNRTKAMFKKTFELYPDWHEQLVAVFAEENWTASFYMLSGTFTGTTSSIPPTGQYAVIQTAIMARFNAAGKQIESWGYFDQFTWFQQAVIHITT